MIWIPNSKTTRNLALDPRKTRTVKLCLPPESIQTESFQNIFLAYENMAPGFLWLVWSLLLSEEIWGRTACWFWLCRFEALTPVFIDPAPSSCTRLFVDFDFASLPHRLSVLQGHSIKYQMRTPKIGNFHNPSRIFLFSLKFFPDSLEWISLKKIVLLKPSCISYSDLGKFIAACTKSYLTLPTVGNPVESLNLGNTGPGEAQMLVHWLFHP